MKEEDQHVPRVVWVGLTWQAAQVSGVTFIAFALVVGACAVPIAAHARGAEIRAGGKCGHNEGPTHAVRH